MPRGLPVALVLSLCACSPFDDSRSLGADESILMAQALLRVADLGTGPFNDMGRIDAIPGFHVTRVLADSVACTSGGVLARSLHLEARPDVDASHVYTSATGSIDPAGCRFALASGTITLEGNPDLAVAGFYSAANLTGRTVLAGLVKWSTDTDRGGRCAVDLTSTPQLARQGDPFGPARVTSRVVQGNICGNVVTFTETAE